MNIARRISKSVEGNIILELAIPGIRELAYGPRVRHFGTIGEIIITGLLKRELYCLVAAVAKPPQRSYLMFPKAALHILVCGILPG